MKNLPSIGTRVVLNAENVVILRCCFAEDDFEIYKNFVYFIKTLYTKQLFCSLNLLFYHVLVAVAVAVCLRSLKNACVNQP